MGSPRAASFPLLTRRLPTQHLNAPRIRAMLPSSRNRLLGDWGWGQFVITRWLRPALCRATAGLDLSPGAERRAAGPGLGLGWTAQSVHLVTWLAELPDQILQWRRAFYEQLLKRLPQYAVSFVVLRTLHAVHLTSGQGHYECVTVTESGRSMDPSPESQSPRDTPSMPIACT